jgi:hypothetical protein
MFPQHAAENDNFNMQACCDAVDVLCMHVRNANLRAGNAWPQCLNRKLKPEVMSIGEYKQSLRRSKEDTIIHFVRRVRGSSSSRESRMR